MKKSHQKSNRHHYNGTALESRFLQILQRFLRKIKRVKNLHVPKYRRFANILILPKKTQKVWEWTFESSPIMRYHLTDHCQEGAEISIRFHFQRQELLGRHLSQDELCHLLLKDQPQHYRQQQMKLH